MERLRQLGPELRERVRELLDDAQLPAIAPARVWAGGGSGELCSVCREPIIEQEPEYELETVVAGIASTFRFHFACYTAWQLELTSEALESDPDGQEESASGSSHSMVRIEVSDN